MDQYVSAKEFKAFFQISKSTLYQWKRKKKIDFITTPSGSIRYRINSIYKKDIKNDNQETERIKSKTSNEINQTSETTNQNKGAIYIRVSSSKQRDGLKRQEIYMSNKYPNFRIFKDIGSGINFKRPQLLNLLEHVKLGSINQIAISSKDRLCRLAIDLFYWYFKQFNCQLLVENESDTTEAEDWENELLSIVQIFCYRWNGRRRYTKKN